MGFVEINEEIIKEIEKVTLDRFHRVGNLVPLEEIEEAFRDLLIEIDKAQEKIEEFEE